MYNLYLHVFVSNGDSLRMIQRKCLFDIANNKTHRLDRSREGKRINISS